MANQGCMLSKTLVIGIVILFIGMSVVSSCRLSIKNSESIETNKENEIMGNRPPYVPSNPIPKNGETDVPIDEIFINWDSEDPDGDDVRYDVYFSESNPPSLVVDNQVYHWYDPGTIDMYTTYYWQIVTTDFWGESTIGPIWNFTTGSRINRLPNPPDISADVLYEGEDSVVFEIHIELSDPDGDNLKAYAVSWDKGLFGFVYKGNWTNGTIIEECRGYGRGWHQITASCLDRWYKWGDDGYLELNIPRNKATANSLFQWFFDRFPLLEVIILRAMNLLR